MNKVHIKNEFLINIAIAQRMFDKFKDELQRSDNYEVNGKVSRETRKSRLNMYRKIINDELLEIERNYGGGKYNFEMAEVMQDEKVNPADILISPVGMENLLVIDQFNDEVIKNNELLLDKPYFSLEEVLDGLNKDGHYLIIVEGPLHGEIYRYNNYGGQEVYLIGKTCGYA